MVGSKQLFFWKFLAFLGLSLAAFLWTRRSRTSQSDILQTDAPVLTLVRDTAPEVIEDDVDPEPERKPEPAATSPFRRTDSDDAIVLSIDDFEDVELNTHKWVKLPSPNARDTEEFPVPTFNASHHHH